MEPTTGLEPVTSSLPRKCSTTELCGREPSITLASARSFPVERVSGIEPPSSAWKAEVLPLNYTRLHAARGANPPHRTLFGSTVSDCPPHMVEGVGFEPTKAKPADLQSAPVDRLGTPPADISRVLSDLGQAVSTNRLPGRTTGHRGAGTACAPSRFARTTPMAARSCRPRPRATSGPADTSGGPLMLRAKRPIKIARAEPAGPHGCRERGTGRSEACS